MAKLPVHIFDTVIYPRFLFVIKGKNHENAIFDGFRTRDDDHLSLEGCKHARAGTWRAKLVEDERQPVGVLIWLIDNIDVEVVAHEAVHAANIIFNDLGVDYDTVHDEHFAHLVGFIADAIWQTWTGKFK